jgi:MFS family permease
MSLREVTRLQWSTLFAAQMGWILDGMDVMLYAFALTSIQKEFGLTSAVAGSMASLTLVTSSFGGILAGWLADRYGRARVLMFSILIYSAFTGATATSQTIWQLALWRCLVGFGLGAEWSAGSVLVAETWAPKYRGRAIAFMQSGWAIGYIFAALLAGYILPRYGWRTLFLCGAAPALFALWVRRNVQEPQIWQALKQKQQGRQPAILPELLKPPNRRNILIASSLCACVLFAYWGLFTWMPAYLASPVSKGGAGLGIVKTTAWIIPLQIGAFLGYTSFGFLADRFGRRNTFAAFTLSAALLIPIFGSGSLSPTALLAMSPLIGFFGHGYFSVFGSLLAELFPSAIRATAQGLCYNAGRLVSAFSPWVIGAVADQQGIGPALAVTSLFFLAGTLVVFLLPESKGAQLA